MTMIFTNGTCLDPVAGVVEVEFWNSMVHLGRFVLNQLTRCCCTAMEPGVPGTLGMRIGARIEPVLISKSAPAMGIFWRVSSERGVYALTRERMATRPKRRVFRIEISIISCRRWPFSQSSNPWKRHGRLSSLWRARGQL